jgi:hypothetical protein
MDARIRVLYLDLGFETSTPIELRTKCGVRDGKMSMNVHINKVFMLGAKV